MGASVGAIVVAAGHSSRMAGIDKLFACLSDRPLLAHTLSPLQASPRVDVVALVVAPDNLERARQLVADFGFSKVSHICLGGARRQDSVRAGLDIIGPCQWLLVHDCARPLLTLDLIDRALTEASEDGAAVPALPVSDTVKEGDAAGHVLRTLDRSSLWAVQTPQAFRYDLLRRAHQEVTDDVTDDAAMLERLGIPVRLFPGSRLNLKVTTPDDLQLAEALLALRAAGADP
jgi:2-C-methyl-D-erythritol 4-phosphate cytidylyltransferase